MFEETCAETGYPPDTPLPTDFDEDIIVLPREVGEDGRGLYDDSVLTIVKEFRATGVTARYQHSQDDRTWIGEKGISTEALGLVIGIGSNAGWAALCWLLRRRHTTDHVRVRVGRFRKTQDEVSWEWYSVKGSGTAVAEALAAIEQPKYQLETDEQEETQNVDG
jgi:hypothetical protein